MTQAIRQTRMREPIPCSPSSIEISEPIARKLNQICTEQDIPIKDLVSLLLQRMLLDHRKETRDVVEKVRCRTI